MAFSRGAVIDILFSLSAALLFMFIVFVLFINALLVVLFSLFAANSRPLLDSMSCTLLPVIAN